MAGQKMKPFDDLNLIIHQMNTKFEHLVIYFDDSILVGQYDKAKLEFDLHLVIAVECPIA